MCLDLNLRKGTERGRVFGEPWTMTMDKLVLVKNTLLMNILLMNVINSGPGRLAEKNPGCCRLLS